MHSLWYNGQVYKPIPRSLLVLQVCKLVQSQQQLSKQLEELSLQFGHAHHAQLNRGELTPRIQKWERFAWSMGGSVVGALAAILMLGIRR